VAVVAFGGISLSERRAWKHSTVFPERYWIGIIKVTWREGECWFHVSIAGLRRERVGPYLQLVCRRIVEDITKFIKMTLALSETDPAWGRTRESFLAVTIDDKLTVDSASFVTDHL